MTIPMPAFLRLVLLADAAASGLMAILLIAGAGLLQSLLGLPVNLMRGAGLVLIPYVAFVAAIGLRPAAPVKAVGAIVACNALWVAASVELLMSGWVSPTMLGTAFVIVQAAAVGLLGLLQYLALRRPAAAARG